MMPMQNTLAQRVAGLGMPPQMGAPMQPHNNVAMPQPIPGMPAPGGTPMQGTAMQPQPMQNAQLPQQMPVQQPQQAQATMQPPPMLNNNLARRVAF